MSAVGFDRLTLPLSDWRSMAPHYADDCRLEQCSYCGCCCHGKTLRADCKVEAAPHGMRCPGDGCGCEGQS